MLEIVHDGQTSCGTLHERPLNSRAIRSVVFAIPPTKRMTEKVEGNQVKPLIKGAYKTSCDLVYWARL